MRGLRSIAPRTRLRRLRFPARERLDGDKVLLTFDDGPDEETPAVLDVLDRLGIRAVFFVVGEQLERAPQLGSEIAARGHSLALHGWGHFRHDRNTAAAASDVQRGLVELEAVAGARPRWFRPPFGRFAQESWAACAELGLAPMYWSASGRDWRRIGASTIALNVRRELDAGAIVLLHDSARYSSRPSVAPTVEAIPLIAEAVRARGLEFAAPGEC